MHKRPAVVLETLSALLFAFAVMSGAAGHVVVRFYGEHSSMWVKPEDLVEMQPQEDSHLDKLHAMRVHPKLKHKCAHAV